MSPVTMHLNAHPDQQPSTTTTPVNPPGGTTVTPKGLGAWLTPLLPTTSNPTSFQPSVLGSTPYSTPSSSSPSTSLVSSPLFGGSPRSDCPDYSPDYNPSDKSDHNPSSCSVFLPVSQPGSSWGNAAPAAAAGAAAAVTPAAAAAAADCGTTAAGWERAISTGAGAAEDSRNREADARRLTTAAEGVHYTDVESGLAATATVTTAAAAACGGGGSVDGQRREAPSAGAAEQEGAAVAERVAAAADDDEASGVSPYREILSFALPVSLAPCSPYTLDSP